jgi:Tol biopolymer transport system component
MIQGTVLAAFVLVLPFATGADAQVTVAASVGSSGLLANAASQSPVLSFDGRFAAFASSATNLTDLDQDGVQDVFLRDRLTGGTYWISVGLFGAQPDGGSWDPSLCADGRYVAFASDASNLVAGDTNGSTDVFVRDTQFQHTLRASVDSAGHPGNDSSLHPLLSGDGRRVAFWSYATNLAPDLVAGLARVFVHDFESGLTTCVSLDSAGQPADADAVVTAISGDGNRIVFWSAAANLVPEDTNGCADVFVRDLAAGTTTRVSCSSAGLQGDADSTRAAISADGRFVAFESRASTLVPADTNASPDVFVRDLQTGLTTRVSLSSGGDQADGPSGSPSISGDGRKVGFESGAANLVANDSNDCSDVFVHDRNNGQTRRASIDSASAQSNGPSRNASISGDGRQVAFDSDATNLVDGDLNAATDVFVRVSSAPAVSFCFGDGLGGIPCPCANNGLQSQGCENSAGTGGALLIVQGTAHPDTLLFTVSGMPPHALAIFLQGNAEADPPLAFGDGLRCATGALRHLYVRSAQDGGASAPGDTELGVSARSAQLGDPIAPGTTRAYQVCYRDRSPSFCPVPLGNTFNASNAVRVYW